MVKLIASDLDGTLLDNNKQLPEGFFEFLDELYEKGIRFAAVSGRQYYSAEEVFLPRRDKMLFIAENGGIAFDCGKMIYSHPLTKEEILAILDTVASLHDKGVRAELSGEKGAWLLDADYDFTERVSMYCRKDRVFKIKDWSEAINSDNIIKIAVYDPNAEKGAFEILKKNHPDLEVILSAQVWVDVVGGGVSKGRAVKEMMDYLGASFDEAMTFGDYLNDYSMMGVCKYSCAVENAHPDLKAAASMIVPSNADNGVVKTIKQVIGMN